MTDDTLTSMGAFPDFIGIGAMRCGTTWISDKLRSHPDIFIPPHFKELHFFDRYYDKGSDWYRAHFSDKTEHQISGEFTPAYIRDAQALELISQTCPQAKLIISIRNPVERAFSHYNFLKKRENISDSFYDALFDDRYEMLKAGLYGEQIENCLKYFSRDRIHIIIFDEIEASPEQVLLDLFEFLEVDKQHQPDMLTEKVNARHGLKSKTFARGLRNIKNMLRPHTSSSQGPIGQGLHKFGKILNKMNATQVTHEAMDPRAGEYLMKYYKDDLLVLNRLIDGKASHWV